MDLLIIIAIVAWVIIKGQAKNQKKADWAQRFDQFGRDISDAAGRVGKSVAKSMDTERDGTLSAAEMRRAFAEGEKKKSRPSAVEIRDHHEARLDAEWEANEEKNRREREASHQRFTAARKKQADSLRVHAAGVDSCEGRLESLKVLYEAGILDREEYAQRVARVKAQHRHSI